MERQNASIVFAPRPIRAKCESLSAHFFQRCSPNQVRSLTTKTRCPRNFVVFLTPSMVNLVETSLTAEPLLSLAVNVTSEHQVDCVLRSIVQGLASQPGVALARIWLLSPPSLCFSCHTRTESSDQAQYLHLVASAGTP